MKTTASDPAEVRATPRATKFSLAANYDPELVPALASYPVDEVYGKFPTDGISSGRPRYLATPVSGEDLQCYTLPGTSTFPMAMAACWDGFPSAPSGRLTIGSRRG